VKRIAKREKELIRRTLEKFGGCQPLEIIGNRDPDHRIAIFSFNIRAGSSYLHPRFVTILLNDLFGIQSRAGCSCAGPYGHRVLHIDGEKSQLLKDRLMHGFVGVRPGWARINFHFLMTDEEFEYITDAICFICEYGKYLLPLYEFDIHTGNWRHRDSTPTDVSFGLAEALSPDREPISEDPATTDLSEKELYALYMDEATKLAKKLKKRFDENAVQTTEKDLIPFVYI
jgi:hypothetical protein